MTNETSSEIHDDGTALVQQNIQQFYDAFNYVETLAYFDRGEELRKMASAVEGQAFDSVPVARVALLSSIVGNMMSGQFHPWDFYDTEVRPSLEPAGLTSTEALGIVEVHLANELQGAQRFSNDSTEKRDFQIATLQKIDDIKRHLRNAKASIDETSLATAELLLIGMQFGVSGPEDRHYFAEALQLKFS